MAGPKCIRAGRLQRGAALLVLLVVVVLGASWFLVSRTSALSAGIFTASNRNHNALVLSQAKQALIGYVAMNAAQSGENNPGRFPCPEGAALVGTSAEGVSAPYVGPPNAPTCATAGRLPWRTLGLDKLVDSSAEPLWYVVSPGWQLVTSTTTLTINSNTIGQLNVDGQANAAVALIIAPGAAMNVAASAGCTARNQTRATPSPTIDARDYIECFNTGTSAFSTTAPTSSFNDQVVRITVADVMPAIEAAIAHRFRRDIAPVIRSTYSNGDAANPNPAWPTVNPVLPFAAPFADPTTSNLKGTRTTAGAVTTGTFQGLLPFVRSYARCSCAPAPCECTPATCTAANDCDPGFIGWTGAATMTGANVYNANCVVTAAQINCSFYLRASLVGGPPASTPFTLTATASNVGMALRQFQAEAPMPGVLAAGRTLSGALNTDGSAALTLNASADTTDASAGFLANALCSLLFPLTTILGCKQDTITVPISVLVDSPLLDQSNATYGWFRRNRWHEVSYYAVAENIAPSGTGACVAPPAVPSCLSVNYLPSSGKQRGLIVLSGRTLTGAARPNGTLSDWLEGANAVVDTVFAVRDPALLVNRTFNDRISVIDENP